MLTLDRRLIDVQRAIDPERCLDEMLMTEDVPALSRGYHNRVVGCERQRGHDGPHTFTVPARSYVW